MKGQTLPVKKEPSGRRSVEAQVEVPGTPEDVWRAIATGPGISSWFVPTTVEEKVGGNTRSSFGPGMDSDGKITVWEPTKCFVAETQEGPGTSPPSGPSRPRTAHMRGSGRAQLVREHGRLGWPVRGPQLWLDRILPEPAALSPTLLWPAVSNRGPFRDVERQGCLGPPGWSTGIGRRKCRCMLRDVGWVAGAERRRRNRSPPQCPGLQLRISNPSPEFAPVRNTDGSACVADATSVPFRRPSACGGQKGRSRLAWLA